MDCRRKSGHSVRGSQRTKGGAEICREHQITQASYYRWRDKFLEGGAKALNSRNSTEAGHQAEIEKLQKIIGKQAIQIEILKKTEEILGRK